MCTQGDSDGGTLPEECKSNSQLGLKASLKRSMAIEEVGRLVADLDLFVCHSDNGPKIATSGPKLQGLCSKAFAQDADRLVDNRGIQGDRASDSLAVDLEVYWGGGCEDSSNDLSRAGGRGRKGDFRRSKGKDVGIDVDLGAGCIQND